MSSYKDIIAVLASNSTFYKEHDISYIIDDEVDDKLHFVAFSDTQRSEMELDEVDLGNFYSSTGENMTVYNVNLEEGHCKFIASNISEFELDKFSPEYHKVITQYIDMDI
jgi:hypothetical protein